MPLGLGNLGESYTILKIQGRDKIINHLKNLGFIENETVSIVSSINGNLIVEVKGTRVALDKSLANRIIV